MQGPVPSDSTAVGDYEIRFYEAEELTLELAREDRVVEQDAGFDVVVLTGLREVRAGEEGPGRVGYHAFSMQDAPWWTRPETPSITVQSRLGQPERPVRLHERAKLGLSVGRRIIVRRTKLRDLDEERNLYPSVSHRVVERLEDSVCIAEGVAREDDTLTGALEQLAEHNGSVTRDRSPRLRASPDELRCRAIVLGSLGKDSSQQGNARPLCVPGECREQRVELLSDPEGGKAGPGQRSADVTRRDPMTKPLERGVANVGDPAGHGLSWK